ncbi:TetR/AcrR family transcriptional regulator C-terminal domain-containing protein [Thermobispora bispora]|jgi:TetR/AcrR family tetracycline transcriptional repressor|uniref:Regulatory protein TetR n=1 Tax=Thermobispora bispora (strain ATCC 19993 / DSM 43833 / CBS 139.67 / JCM 10125 / KCTC 9307 / NBRC 14880 / R51) TaxID=469371 RepID=D6YB55_THEBD|nr:TetR/AcrR family transcriptional regulator C-terminal domain-containing protein [Thermobispora bispora]ADG88415.1 regulatory protein TetR [Thermobispora bispora DSM 43833]MBO2475264.1 TetR family transcriptional regulator [Actinomycetales bacterium]MDI9580311.1 TetR/AcrR family transcriptional regulator C-terminal domain-containing protein [Thermobispora sp.]QSI48231.1 TetR family transcriptional regulator [Thermobispora bispora]
MPAKRPPVPLSRERIIEAALHLADAEGLRRLTMRKLGDALQVEAMAIYHHLPRGKEALFDALAEHVTAVHVDPGPAAGWQDIARAWARARRAALLEHPGVLSLALTRPPKGAALASLTEQTEQLREAGLGDAAPAAVRALLAYVYGSVAVELQRSGWADPDAEVREVRTAEGEREFAEGLDALIAGISGWARDGSGTRP